MLLVFGGTGCVDDREIEDRSLPQQGGFIFERLLDHLENVLDDSVLLEEMQKVQDRCLIQNLLRDHINPDKAPETRSICLHLFHQRFREREPVWSK